MDDRWHAKHDDSVTLVQYINLFFILYDYFANRDYNGKLKMEHVKN